MLAASAIGAGIAMIAGFGPGIGQDLRQARQWRLLPVSLKLKNDIVEL